MGPFFPTIIDWLLDKEEFQPLIALYGGNWYPADINININIYLYIYIYIYIYNCSVYIQGHEIYTLHHFKKDVCAAYWRGSISFISWRLL